jgi:hypothetical protein
VSVKDVCVNYREICGYAEVPEPSHPEELKADAKHFSQLFSFKTTRTFKFLYTFFKLKTLFLLLK